MLKGASPLFVGIEVVAAERAEEEPAEEEVNRCGSS